MSDLDLDAILARAAVAIGLEEFERCGKPHSVQPRHFETARAVLNVLADTLHVQGVGVRADMLNTTSRLFTDAADAPGPDRQHAEEVACNE